MKNFSQNTPPGHPEPPACDCINYRIDKKHAMSKDVAHIPTHMFRLFRHLLFSLVFTLRGLALLPGLSPDKPEEYCLSFSGLSGNRPGKKRLLVKPEMTMCVLLLLLLSTFSFSQSDLIHMPSTKYFLSGKDTVMLSLKPVTNREYLIYIMWVYSVYGTDYPESVFEVIPGLVRYDSTGSVSEVFNPDNEPFHALCRFCPKYVEKYMFNAKYADYPVLGVSWYQAGKFLEWYSDRYNESTLIRKEKLVENFGQMNEDCFVTESYLCGQYMGAEGKDQFRIAWSDRLLIPAFRLPTRSELVTAGRSKMVKNDIDLYPYEKTELIELFAKELVDITANKIVFKTVNGFKEEFRSKEEFEIDDFSYEEMTLDTDTADDAELRSFREIFEINGQPIYQFSDFVESEKDSSGHMPYIFIAEDKNKMPVIAGPYLKTTEFKTDSATLTYFRYACSIKSDRIRLK